MTDRILSNEELDAVVDEIHNDIKEARRIGLEYDVKVREMEDYERTNPTLPIIDSHRLLAALVEDLKAFLSDLLNGDVVFTGPSAERLRQQAADLLEPKQEIDE